MAQTRIQGFLSFLRRYPVITFLLQQIFLFVAAVIFLTTVRKLTGKTIHGGKDPLGLGDGVAALLLFALFVLLTVWFYRVVMSKDAPPLGLNPSIRSIPEFVLGSLVAFLVNAGPLLVALGSRRAHVVDVRSHHLDGMVLQSFVLTCLAMLGNSYVEEATSRAFPIQVLRRYSVLFRILVPTLFFAVIHLADEKFSASAFYSRIVAGVAFSLGYFATGNVWLVSGLHTGWNYGETWADGNWTGVAAVSVDGGPLGPVWIPNAIWTLLVIGASVWLWRRVPFVPASGFRD